MSAVLVNFFGPLSPFQIIVAIAALGSIPISLYTLYKNFLEHAKVHLYPGDRISFVTGAPGEIRKFHLSANLVNEAVKIGTVHRLEAVVTGPAIQNFVIFSWNLFFEYTPDGTARKPVSAPHAIAIPGKTSHLARVEFELLSPYKAPAWSDGDYTFNIRGWVNRENRKTKPNLHATFHVRLTSGHTHSFATPLPRAGFLDVEIAEWSTLP